VGQKKGQKVKLEEYLYGAVRKQNRNTDYKIFSKTSKEDRHYIKSPADAPEGANVQQGPRGGLYYDTEGKTFRQDRISLKEDDINQAVQTADWFVMENDIEEFKQMIPEMHDNELIALRYGIDVVSRRNPNTASFSLETINEAQKRDLDTRIDPVPIGEVDEELIANREKDLTDMMNSGQKSLTFYHVTLPEYADSIMSQGMIPGKKKPTGQYWQPKYLGNYFHSVPEPALRDASDGEEYGGRMTVLEINVPLNSETIPEIARQLHPDEDANLNAFAPINQTLETSVAYSDDIPPEWISVYKSNTEPNKDSKPEYQPIIDKLKKYSADYKSEGNDELSSEADEVALMLQQGDIQGARQKFISGDLAIDIPQTYEEVNQLSHEDYVIENIGEDFATNPGTFEVFRSGEPKSTPNGIFFSADEEGAKQYADKGKELKKYKITIKKPLVAGRVEDAYTKLTGKDKSVLTGEEWLALDKKVASLAKQAGYDAITYTNPAPPAHREIVVFDIGSVESPDSKSQQESYHPKSKAQPETLNLTQDINDAYEELMLKW
jgi:hypothetical protein